MPDVKANYYQNKLKHVKAVQALTGRLIDILRSQVHDHDSDKLDKSKRGEDIDKREHRDTQRHHFLATHPEQVTLLDLIEMVSDVTATVQEKGEPAVIITNDNNLPDILRTLIQNTMNLLEKHEIKYVSIDDIDSELGSESTHAYNPPFETEKNQEKEEKKL